MSRIGPTKFKSFSNIWDDFWQYYVVQSEDALKNPYCHKCMVLVWFSCCYKKFQKQNGETRGED